MCDHGGQALSTGKARHTCTRCRRPHRSRVRARGLDAALAPRSTAASSARAGGTSCARRAASSSPAAAPHAPRSRGQSYPVHALAHLFGFELLGGPHWKDLPFNRAAPDIRYRAFLRSDREPELQLRGAIGDVAALGALVCVRPKPVGSHGLERSPVMAAEASPQGLFLVGHDGVGRRKDPRRGRVLRRCLCDDADARSR